MRSTRKVVGVELAHPKMRRELMIAAVRELGDVRGLGSSDRAGGGHQGRAHDGILFDRRPNTERDNSDYSD